MGLIDTAEGYNPWGDEPGVGERHVGEQTQQFRDEILVATKISPANLGYNDVLAHAEASRQRLRANVIDLYQIHSPNTAIPIAETMRAMRRLIADGVIRFVGVSNFEVHGLRDAQDALGDIPLVSNQVQYNLFHRAIETDVLPYCQEHSITVIAYEPLALGRIAEGPGRAALRQVAEDTSRTPAQVMLNWLVRHEGVVAIPKTDRLERVDEAAAAAGWSLTAAQYSALEALS